MKHQVQTIAGLLAEATEALAASSDSPRLDAEVLLSHVAKLTPTQLIVKANQSLDREAVTRFRDALERRLAGEPVAYITGEREFWSLPLEVSPATLIPRPETELLVEQALSVIPQEDEWRVIDLGTGTGAIALAIAKERPRCRVLATDYSLQALAVAERNAMRLEIANVEFVGASWLDFDYGEPFNLIISNPPYIASDDPHLHQGDVSSEPVSALASGVDGLDDIRIIVRQAAGALNDDGWLMLECGYEQGSAVKALMQKAGFSQVNVISDFAGHDRVVSGFLSGPNARKDI